MKQHSATHLKFQEGVVNPWTIWAIVIIIVLGMVVGYNYAVHKIRKDHEKVVRGDAPPPISGRLEEDLHAVERSGERVSLSQLKGKIMVISYVFTRCPRGCPGVIGIKKSLQERFGKDPRFHLVSVTLDGGYDTPETLRAFADKHEVEGDNWWFLTGEPRESEEDQLKERNRLRRYLSTHLKFHDVTTIPEAERLNENDLYSHDARVAVVDHRAQVRGLHEVLHSQLSDVVYENLINDLEKIFAEADAEAAGK